MIFEYPEKLLDFAKEVTDIGRNDRDAKDRLVDWIINSGYAPFLKIDLTFDHEQAMREVMAVEQADLIVPYSTRYNGIMKDPSRGWQATALFGVAAKHPQNPISDLSSYDTVAPTNVWTESADLMPYFCNFVQENVGEVKRMVMLKFPPGGFVPPHRDYGIDASLDDYKLSQVNFHIQWPPGSVWYMEDAENGVHATENGTVTMHSFYHKHAVVNDNLDTDRYFAYGFFNYHESFKDKIIQSFTKYVTG